MKNYGYFMEPISIYSSSALFGNKCYWVNGQRIPLGGGATYNPPPGIAIAGVLGSAVAAAPNDGGSAYPIYTWVEQNAAGNVVKYKYPQSNVFDFRTAAPAAVGSVAGNDWKLYPNPTASELHIQTGNATTAYSITDMAGKALGHGTITGADATIPTGTLAAGTYVLQLYNGNEATGKMLFIKE